MLTSQALQLLLFQAKHLQDVLQLRLLSSFKEIINKNSLDAESTFHKIISNFRISSARKKKLLTEFNRKRKVALLVNGRIDTFLQRKLDSSVVYPSFITTLFIYD